MPSLSDANPRPVSSDGVSEEEQRPSSASEIHNDVKKFDVTDTNVDAFRLSTDAEAALQTSTGFTPSADAADAASHPRPTPDVSSDDETDSGLKRVEAAGEMKERNDDDGDVVDDDGDDDLRLIQRVFTGS